MTILNDIEKAEAAATQGPWDARGKDVRVYCLHHDHRMAHASTDENGALIALSRNHLKTLIECARALEWYENDDNWSGKNKTANWDSMNCALEDRGQRARDALKKLEGAVK